MKKRGKVFFIGGGCGDPELITLKALKVIEKADMIIYAGSLVNKEILNYSKNKDVEIYNSAEMKLEDICSKMIEAAKNGKIVARIHTGDPSIYGAIQEQMVFLEESEVEYEIIPGVSSAFCAAARIKNEFTIPGITQTVIFTRVQGKTSVPEKEKLSYLAKTKATIVIFLSVSLIDKVKKELLEGFTPDTPVIIAKRVSWEDEEIFYTDIENMDKVVKEHNIKKTALILVGEVFRKNKKIYRSFLYS